MKGLVLAAVAVTGMVLLPRIFPPDDVAESVITGVEDTYTKATNQEARLDVYGCLLEDPACQWDEQNRIVNP